MNIEGLNIKNWLLVVIQAIIAVFMCYQCMIIKEQNGIIKEQNDRIKCQRLSDRYFNIYKHYKKDLEDLKPSSHPDENPYKVEEELIRIANNTIRHFSFESENAYLVFKALENVLSYKYPENKTDLENKKEHKNKKDPENQKNHILANLKEEKPQLSEIIEALKEDNEKWPNEKDYNLWNKETECF